MDYQTKYHFQRVDSKGVTTLVKLKLRDYAGADTALTHGGITFEFGKNRTDGVIRGSSATVGLWSLTQGQYSEFRDITDRKWMVEVIKGGQPYWYGWLTPEIFNEPFKHSLPYRIELTAVDGLGDLQNIDYLDADGNRYTGRESFKSIINHCLNSISFGLNVCFSASVRPSGTVGDMFEDCYYSNGSFVDKDGKVLKCSDVLQLFFVLGITVKQWRGKWYVLRTEDLTDNTLIYEYDSAGNYVDDYYLDLNYTIDDTADAGAENLPIGQSGLRSQEAAYKEASIKIDFGKKPSFLNNYDFSKPGDSWTGPAGMLNYSEGKDCTYGMLYNQDASGATTGIHQSVNVVATEEDFVFSLKVAPFGWSGASGSRIHPINISIRFQVKLTGSQTYYLNKDTGWTTVPCFIDIADLESSIGASDINWHNIKIITNSLPTSGAMDVFLCKLQYIGSPSSDIRWVGVGYTDVFAYPDGDVYLSSREIKGINNPDYNYIPSTAELKINDCPNVPNARLIYSNFISDSAGVPTTVWQLDGVAGTMTLSELYLRHIISLHRRPVKIITMTMRGQVEWPGTLSDKEGNRYEVVSATLMDRNCEWQLELREILSYGESAPTIIDGSRIYDNSQNSTRTINDKNDYRVFVNGIGSPKRINDLTRANALEDGHRVEVDKPGSNESQYVEATQIADYIKGKLGVTVQADKTIWDRDMHIEGNITASQKVIAWVAGAVESQVLANLSASAPLRKSSASNIVLDYNGNHFEVTGGALQIKSGVLVPANHSHIISDITGLQTVLDGKMAIHTHPYRPDTWVPDWSDISNKPLTFVPSAHGHAWSEITDKPLTFVPSAHSHIISDITGLQTALDGKMAVHTHPYRSDTWVPAWSEITSKPEWVAKMGWDGTAVTIASTLRITGNLEASEKVIAWVAGAVGSNVLANLSATAPLRKSSDSNIVLDVNGNQFEVNASNQLQIKSGILAPAAHTHVISEVTGLQTALDAKMAIHTHPYLSDSDYRIAQWSGAVTAINAGALIGNYHLKWDGSKLVNSKILETINGDVTNIKLGYAGNFAAYNVTYPTLYITNNAYYNSGWKRINNGYASDIHMDEGGNITLKTAVSGNAGDAITWIDVLQILNSGKISSLGSIGYEMLRTGNDWGWSIYADASNFLKISAGTASNTKSSTWLTMLDGTGSTTIHSTTASTSTLTGALIVGGGLGVGGNIYAGGNLTSGDNIYVNPSSGSSFTQYKLNGTIKSWMGVAGSAGDLLNEASTGDVIIRSQLGRVLLGTYISGDSDAYAGLIIENNLNAIFKNSVKAQSYIIKNSSGVTKWTLTLGSNDRLEIKNAAGVVVNMITQSGEQHSNSKLTAHSTSI